MRLLVHLGGNTQALQDLLVSMMAIRDQWIHRVGADLVTMRDVLADRQRKELANFREALGDRELEDAEAILIRLGHAAEDRDSAAARFAQVLDHPQPGPAGELLQAYWLCQVLTTVL